MSKVVTFGELMLRLKTPDNLRFVQSESFEATYGGGEANVCVSLSNYGHDAYFMSALPTNSIGDAAINSLRRYGVNTEYVVRNEHRMGIYYLEAGASVRASKVIYDRADSAVCNISADQFDFEAIFKDADWFHWSGITPAIDKRTAAVLKVACEEAKKYGVKISVDLNFRKKLWSSEESQAVMRPLMQYVDVCIGNEEDLALSLGFVSDKIDVTKGHLDLDAYREILKEARAEFGFDKICCTLRESHSASDNGWSAILYNGNDFVTSKKYELRIIDRVGGGDSFASGLICGLLDKPNDQEAIEFATAASALKHTILGDFNQVSKEEVEALAGGDGSGRVQR